MATPRALLALLAAAAAGSCGGGDAPKPSPKKEDAKKADAPKPAEKGGGLNLSALKKGGDGAKPADPPPAAAPAPDGKGPAAKKEEPKKADPKAEAPKEEEAKAEAKTPGVPVPGSPDEVTDTEVLASWSQDEREALNEMPADEKAKEMRKRRLEIFKSRGGVLDPNAGKTSASAPGADGERGPARPETPKEAAPTELRGILDDIASKDPEIRARGIENAKLYPDKAVAAHHILPLLQDSDPDLRAIAASTLGTLKSADAVPALEKLIEKGDKDPVRAMAIKALGDIGGKVGMAAVRRIARDGSEPSDRAASLGILIKAREVGEVRDLIGEALKDLSPEVRAQAATAVREFELKAFEADLAPLLDDISSQVVVEAMRAYGALGTRSAVGPLVKVLTKPDPEAEDLEAIQNAANAALEKITGVKQGYNSTLPDAKVAAAIDAWRVWWKANKDKWK